MSVHSSQDAEQVRSTLIAAATESRLLEEICSLVVDGDMSAEDVAQMVASLHNAREVDALQAFLGLANEGGAIFFMVKSVIEGALPSLDSSVLEVMRVVVHLCREGGHDSMAGSAIGPFMAFCEEDIERCRGAMSLLEDRPEEFGELLIAIVTVGAKVEPNEFFEYARRLSLRGDDSQRQRAVVAIGRLAVSAAVPVLDALQAIDQAHHAADHDQVRAAAVRAYGEVLAGLSTGYEEVDQLLVKAVEQGGDQTLHECSELLWLRWGNIPIGTAESLFRQLERVESKNTATLRCIDFAVSATLPSPLRQYGLRLLRALLESGKVSMEAFRATAASLGRDDGLSALATEWFSAGHRPLCQAVGDVVNTRHKDAMNLRFDDSTLSLAGDTADRVFVAKRVVGFLFNKPKTAIGFLASLLTGQDPEADSSVSELIIDPMLINYPGSGREALVTAIDAASTGVQPSLRALLDVLDGYLERITSTPRLRALEVQQVERESYRRYLASTMEESMKEAEKKSALLSLMHRSTLLYGRSSVSYVDQLDGSSQRMEVPMSTHGVSVEFPRMSNIDPVGLDFRLRVLRNETRS